MNDVHWLAGLGVWLENLHWGGFMVHHNSELSLVVEVKSKHHHLPQLMELKESVLCMFHESFSQGGMGSLVLRYIVCTGCC